MSLLNFLPSARGLTVALRLQMDHLFMLYQLLQHHYRLILFIRAVAVSAWIGLIYLFYTGHLPHHLGVYAGSLLVGESGFLILVPRLPGLLRTLYCVGSRMWIVITLFVCMTALVISLFSSTHLLMAVMPALSLYAYARIAFHCHKQFRPYLIDWNGVNPLSRDGKRAWLNPEAEAIEAGDVVITGHKDARKAHEAEGHGEISDGDELWSSYFAYGVRHQNIAGPKGKIADLNREGERYFVLRPKRKLSAAELVQFKALLKHFWCVNKEWRRKHNAFRRSLIRLIPFASKATRKKWVKKWRATGYDFWALVHGDRSTVMFTCVTLAVRMLEAFKLNERQYEVDIFGIPFGILVPPVFPWQLMDDTGLELLTVDDQKRYEEENGITLPVPPIPADVLNHKPSHIEKMWVAGEKAALSVGDRVSATIIPLMKKDKAKKAA